MNTTDNGEVYHLTNASSTTYTITTTSASSDSTQYWFYNDGTLTVAPPDPLERLSSMIEDFMENYR